EVQIREDAQKIIDGEESANIPNKVKELLLSSESLELTEIKIFQLAQTWSNGDKNALKSFIPLINFKFISPNDMSSIVYESRLFSEAELFHKMKANFDGFN